MGLAFTLIYIVLQFVSVAQIEFLRGTKIMVVLSVLACLGSLLPLAASARYIINRQFILMVLFLGWVLFSQVPHGWIGGILVIFLEFFPASILFFLIAVNVRSIGTLRIVGFVVIAMLTYLMATGIYSYNNHQGEEDTTYVMVQKVENASPILRLRATGIIEDPNEFSQLLLSWLPIMMMIGTRKKGLSMGLLIKIPIALLILTSIYYSHSRGALIGVALLLVLAIPKKYRAFGVVLSVGGVIVLGVVSKFGGTGRAVSLEGGRDRLDIWSDGLSFVKRSPIWGIGFGSFPDEAILTAHNSFLLCVAELGIVGYLLWLSVLIVSIRQLVVIHAAPALDENAMELQRWAKALTMSLYVYLVTGFFLSQTYHAGLYLLLGLTAAVASIHAERHRVSEVIPQGGWWIRWAFASCFASILLIYAMVRSRSV